MRPNDSCSTVLVQAVTGEQDAWDISHQQEATSVGMSLLYLEEKAKGKKGLSFWTHWLGYRPAAVEAVLPQPAQARAALAQPDFQQCQSCEGGGKK